MIKRRLLSYDISQLTKAFKKDFPQLVTMAEESESAALFKEALRSFVSSRIDRTVGGSNMGNVVAKRIFLLIEHDGMMVSELSTGEEIPVRTITCLWQFLAGKLEEDVSPDFFIDLYRQFELLEKPEEIVPDRSLVKRQMNRWPTGLDEEVMAIRHSNKERIIAGLIRKIERCHAPTSRFQFTEEMSYAEKYVKVQEWWNTGRFHLAMAFKSPTELNYFLGGSLSAGTMDLLARARKKGMPFFVTPYYLSLLNTNTSGYDDATIRSYILIFGRAGRYIRPDQGVGERRYCRVRTAKCRRVVVAGRTQHTPSLSGSGDLNPRFDGACLWRAVCFLPADV